MLLAIFDDRIAMNLLAGVGFGWSTASTEPAQYLHDYRDDEVGNTLALARSRLRRSSPAGDSEDGGEVLGGARRWRRRRVPGDVGAAVARTLVKSLQRRWQPYSTSVRERFQGYKTSLVGMLILHGGSAALPVVDKLLAAGKVRLVGSSLLLPTIHHFLVRSWIEEQLLLPNAKAFTSTLDPGECTLGLVVLAVRISHRL